MAEMNIPEGGKGKDKVRMKKATLRVDLTPMVDLAFLLIAFFMLTTSLIRQKTMEMNEPEQTPAPTEVSECQVLNILTDSLGKTYYWEGLECKRVNEISISGSHNLKDKIAEKNNYLKTHCLYRSGNPKSLICLIKILPGSHYEQMVSILDEMNVCKVSTYAMQNYTDDELKAVDNAHKQISLR